MVFTDCLQSFINSSHAECHFSGVSPGSTVHWFQGDHNLTDSASTMEEVDQHGRYSIQSKITVENGEAYNCSLWAPHDETYVFTQQLRTNSLGSTFRLQWLCIMVQILMLKSGLAL